MQSATSTSVTVKATSIGVASIQANFANGIFVKKDLWAGQPSTPPSISDPSTVQSGAFTYCYGSASNGAQSYQWKLPNPYNVVTTFDIFGQNWQMQNTTTYNSLYVFTGYGGDNGYIEIRGQNPCGLSDARQMYVPHDPNGGGSIPRIEQPGQTEIVIYPNPSDGRISIAAMKKSGEFNDLKTIKSIKIINQNLETVYKSEFENPVENHDIDLSGISKGLYKVMVEIKTSVICKKLSIQ